MNLKCIHVLLSKCSSMKNPIRLFLFQINQIEASMIRTTNINKIVLRIINNKPVGSIYEDPF